jgi:hypothetical protein
MRSELAHFLPASSGDVAWPDAGAAPEKRWEHRARTLRRTLGRHRCPSGGSSSLGQNGGWCLVGGNHRDECCSAKDPTCKRCRFGYYIPWPHAEADTGLGKALASFFAGKSVIDLGAGVGQYGQYFKAHPSADGAVQYRGYDGAENAEEYTNGFLQWADLSWETDIEPAEWVMSFEVGEHIDRKFEGEFIRNLHRCNTQGIVYSWALPGQGGFHHINLRSAEYLRGEFEKLGYVEDIEASKKLREVSNAYWFRQNTHVFRRVASGGASPQSRRADRIP